MANLGINAEDMYGMIKHRFKNKKIEPRDLDPFKYPTQEELNKNNILGIFLETMCLGM